MGEVLVIVDHRGGGGGESCVIVRQRAMLYDVAVMEGPHTTSWRILGHVQKPGCIVQSSRDVVRHCLISCDVADIRTLFFACSNRTTVIVFR